MQHEQREGGAEGPLVTLDRTARALRVDLRLRHLADSFRGEQPRRLLVERRVKSAGGFRDFFHARGIELRLHHLARRVAHEFSRSKGNFRSLGGTDTDGEDTDTIGRRLARGGQTIGIEFLAVRNDDDGTGKSLGLGESFPARADGRGEVGAPLGYEVGVEFVEGGQHRAVVEGQRRLEEGGAREGDQTDAIAAQLGDQVLGQQLGPLQPGRCHVGGHHGTRNVHGNDHVASAVGNLESVIAEPRLGQGHHEQREGGDDAGAPENPAERTGVPRQDGAQLRRDDPPDEGPAPPLGPPKEGGDRHKEPEEVQHPGLSETQGRRLHIV